jgi:chemotaxis protein MotB
VPQRSLLESRKLAADRLPAEAKAAALEAAERRRRDAEAQMDALHRRAREIPGEALYLEESLRSALGNVAAESHTARIRGLSDRIHEAEATCALLKLAAGAPGQLQAWSDVTAPFARAAREDFRAVRSMLESACAEESKQRAEIMLNANVLAMCVEQARRLKDAAASVAEEDYRRLADAAAAARARFGAACAESLAAATDDLRAEEANLAAAAAELTERRLAREEDQRRALEQRSRLADEFATLKGTVDRFRESESEQCLALAAEVAALERDAQARLANEALALQTEVAAIRAVSAVEAERIGSQMLVRFREETEVAVESIRASATQRFQLVVDEVAALVSEEFDMLVSSIEQQRSANEERVARLREQVALLAAQVEAVRRVSAAQAALQRGEASGQHQARLQEETRLQQLKQRVRRLWQERDGDVALPSAQRTKLGFLLRAVRSAPFSARFNAVLLQHMRDARDRRVRRDADADAARAARDEFAGAAAHITGGRASVSFRGVGGGSSGRAGASLAEIASSWPV